MYYIYSIFNQINYKQYIGKTKNIKRRYNEHKKLLKKNKHFNSHLQYSWNKYGEDVFLFKIIDKNISEDLIDDFEKEYINFFNCQDESFGYNILSGGNSPPINLKEDHHFYKELDDEKIIDLYVNQKESSLKIGKIFNVSKKTILRRLRWNNIEIRESKISNTLDLDNDKIKKLYTEEKKSTEEIAEIFNCSSTVILYRLEDMKVKRRSKRERQFKYFNLFGDSNFSYDKNTYKNWNGKNIRKSFSLLKKYKKVYKIGRFIDFISPTIISNIIEKEFNN